jgi:hypothetical protein
MAPDTVSVAAAYTWHPFCLNLTFNLFQCFAVPNPLHKFQLRPREKLTNNLDENTCIDIKVCVLLRFMKHLFYIADNYDASKPDYTGMGQKMRTLTLPPALRHQSAPMFAFSLTH